MPRITIPVPSVPPVPSAPRSPHAASSPEEPQLRDQAAGAPASPAPSTFETAPGEPPVVPVFTAPESTAFDVRVGLSGLPPVPVAALIKAGYVVDEIHVDYEREGRISVPGAPSWSVDVDSLAAHARLDGRDLAASMTPLTLTKEGGRAPEQGVVSVFIPGLNTPEPEGSRRTQLYVDALDVPMASMANGTRESLGDYFPLGPLPVRVPARQRDWILAGLSYLGLHESPLSQKIADLLATNLAQPEPNKMRLAFYSDATISCVQGLARFKEQEVARRINLARARGERPDAHEVVAEIERDLKEYVFIELHGNACFSLPRGPRYLAWTDVNDPLTFGKNPIAPQGRRGVCGAHPDPDYDDVVYVDYEGPYSHMGFNAHNLPASGIHVVREVLRRNGAAHGEELYDLAKGGRPLDIPRAGQLAGDRAELWGD